MGVGIAGLTEEPTLGSILNLFYSFIRVHVDIGVVE